MLPGQLALEIPPAGAPMPPPGSVVRRAVLQPKARPEIRLTLERRWRQEGPHVLFIGHNQNKADNRKEDGSSRRWTGYAWRWGYAGYIAVNLYPLRTGVPDNCVDWAGSLAGRTMMGTNLGVIAREAKTAALIVACWGAIAVEPEVVDTTLMALSVALDRPCQIHCLAITAGGAPKHVMARGRQALSPYAQPILWKELP